MRNSEFKLILEDISKKLSVLIEAQNLLIQKIDRYYEEGRASRNENKGHFGSIGKDLYESQGKTELHVSE
jgi:hypothetical protein